ncbi:MAG: mechanosensitive ion channel domain-containing protein [Planctomycetota bacterium]
MSNRTRVPAVVTLVLLPCSLAALALAQEESPWKRDELVITELVAERDRARDAIAALEAGELANAQELMRVPSISAEDLAEWKAAATSREKALGNLVRTADELQGLSTEEEIRAMLDRAEAARADLQGRGDARAPAVVGEEELRTFEAELRKASEAREAAARHQAEVREQIRQLRRQVTDLPAREAELARAMEEDAPDMGGALAVCRRDTLEIDLRHVRERLRFARIGLPRLSLLLQAREREFELAEAVLEWEEARFARAKQGFLEGQGRLAEHWEEMAASAEAEARRIDDPILRFRKETDVEVFRLKAVEAQDDLFLTKTLKELLRLQQAATKRLEEARTRLLQRFEGGQAAVSTRASEILLHNLNLVREARSALAKRLQPQLGDYLATYLGRRADLQDRLWDLEAPIAESESYQALLATTPPEGQEGLRQTFEEERRRLREANQDLEGSLDELIDHLWMLDADYAKRRQILDGLYSIVIRRIYWVRSDPPLGLRAFLGVRDEITRAARTCSSAETRRGISGALRERTGMLVLMALGFLASLGMALWAHRRLRGYEARWRFRGGPLLAALQRLAVAILLSALSPLCLAAAALLLTLSGLPEVVVFPGTLLLLGLAAILFLRRVLWVLFREGGIAVRDLRAPQDVALQLLGFSRWTGLGLLVLVLPWWVLGSTPLAPPLVHLPRVLFTAMLVFFSVVVAGLLRRQGALVSQLTKRTGFWYQAWFFIWPLLIVGFAAIVVMDVLGYRFGARMLTVNVVQTLVAGFVIVGAYNLLAGLTREAAQRVRARRQRDVPAEDIQERSIEGLEQVSRLVGVAAAVFAVVLLAGLWGITEGLRGFCESIRFATVDAEKQVYLTLWDAFAAIAWIVGAHFFVRNLRGLYEAVLFSRMEKIDTGSRFVIVTVSKYVVLLVGYCAAILSLHISFSSLGWAFAAASIGIGFGLQEIVSNFVSGLILFFERPVRVGDTISVGDTLGTVERISIRATQVLNLDRQVIIIPNREFVSARVVNWSHNDLTVRSAAEVGVAYGSDVEKVRRVLLEVASSHPDVKKDPEPKVWFTSFGDSSLTFRMLVFTDIEERFPVLSALHMKIDERFKEEGIEIAFPQRDLHLRSVRDETVLSRLRSSAEAEGPAAAGRPRSPDPDSGH